VYISVEGDQVYGMSLHSIECPLSTCNLSDFFIRVTAFLK